MDNNKVIAKRLIEIREQNQNTQKEIAEIANVRQSCVSKWERGETKPGLKKLLLIANFFKISMDYILGLKDTK